MAADRTRYEALYLVGYDAETGGYGFHLFDTFGSAYSGTVGVGRRVDHTIAFVFDYPSGRLVNRFTWSPADETWAMELVDVTPTGAGADAGIGNEEGSVAHAKTVRFRAGILQTGNNTGIPVPEDVLASLGGGKRPLVVVTVERYTYRGAVGSMAGKPMVALSAEQRAAAGVRGGDEVDVALRLDLEPRTVQLPADLRAALVEAGALDAFEAAAPSRKKEDVRQVEAAKAPETRQRRIEKIVAKLRDA